jgi:HEAT repeat protein
VLDFACRLVRERARPLLSNALQDPDYIVREAAADAIGDYAHAELEQNLLEFRSDPHPDVRQAVETALEQLNS